MKAWDLGEGLASKIFHKEPKKEDNERSLSLLPVISELEEIFTFIYQCSENVYDSFFLNRVTIQIL